MTEPERLLLDAASGAKALTGTGFNPDNPQHLRGSDAPRYAITLQQMRDAGRFSDLDRARARVARWFFVMQERDGTRLLCHPVGWHTWSKARQKAFRLADHRMFLADGILYDKESEE